MNYYTFQTNSTDPFPLFEDLNSDLSNDALKFCVENQQWRDEYPNILKQVLFSLREHRVFCVSSEYAWTVTAEYDRQTDCIMWTISGGEIICGCANQQELNTLRSEIRGLRWLESYLSHQKEQFERVEFIAHVGHWIYDCDENMYDWSDELYRILKWEKGLLTPTVDDFIESIHPDDRELFRNAYQDHLDNEEELSLEFRVVRTDGVKRIVELRSCFQEVGKSGKRKSCNVVQDITEYCRITSQYEESQRILYQLSDNIRELFILFDAKTEKALYVSHAYSEMYGYAIPANLDFESLILKSVSVEEASQLRALFRVVISEGGDSHSGEYSIVTDTQEKKILQIQIIPIRDELNVLIRAVTVIRDITREKLAQEQKRVQEKFIRQADQMAKLSTLVSGIAHEINNPNNLIMLNCTFLMKLWQDVIQILDKYGASHPDFMIHNLPYNEVREEFVSMLQSILNGSDRIKATVASLKQFAGVDSGSFDETINLNLLVERTLLITSAMIRKTPATYSVNYSSGCGYVKGNTQQLQQVLVNVITNACQALKGIQGTITITISHTESTAIIEIADSGCGIPSGQVERIMDPFFTTHRELGCEGLGLTVAYGIVTAHEGFIDISSEQTIGTTVTISIPLYQYTL